MPQIPGVILPQKFELIRDRIADILIDEIEGQYDYTEDEDLNLAVSVERVIPIDNTEAPLINVSLARGSYDNKNAVTVDGTYNYHIDVYTNAEEEEEVKGDYAAAAHGQKLLGVCRSILENSIYNTLGFSKPSISHVSVSEITIAEPAKSDALSHYMGRLLLSVRVAESTNLKPIQLVSTYETRIKIAETQKGYYYIGGEEV